MILILNDNTNKTSNNTLNKNSLYRELTCIADICKQCEFELLNYKIKNIASKEFINMIKNLSNYYYKSTVEFYYIAPCIEEELSLTNFLNKNCNKIKFNIIFFMYNKNTSMIKLNLGFSTIELCFKKLMLDIQNQEKNKLYQRIRNLLCIFALNEIILFDKNQNLSNFYKILLDKLKDIKYMKIFSLALKILKNTKFILIPQYN